MIKEIVIKEQISLSPKLLNTNIISTIESIFSKKVLNRCDDDIGFIMEVISITSVKGGNIVGDYGNVIYDVLGKVKTFTIDKDEIIDGIVIKLDQKGLFAQNGPFQIFVSITKFPSNYKYENGMYIRPDGSKLKMGDMIKIKVIGKKLSTQNKMVVGSIEP